MVKKNDLIWFWLYIHECRKKVRILDFSDTTANILEYIVKFSNDGKLYLWFLFWKNKKSQKSKHFLSLKGK